MLKLRILTVAIVLPLFVAAIFFLPNSWWGVALFFPLLVAGHEWARLCGFGHPGETVFLAALMGGCALMWMFVNNGWARAGHLAAVADRAVYLVSAIFWCVVAPWWLRLQLTVRNRVVLAAVGLIVLLPTWLALAQLQHNAELLLALLGVVWISDSAAFFAGRALGRHKLAMAISPGKTWEGVAGALVAVTLYAFVMSMSLFSNRNIWILVLALLAITYLGIIGDLFESWVKRNAGVKDSGDIFPGHGGMLDRIDAITAAMPVAALIFTSA